MDIDDVLKKLGFTPLGTYRPRMYERKTSSTNLLVDIGNGNSAIAIYHGSYRVNREYVHFKCDNAAMLEFMIANVCILQMMENDIRLRSVADEWRDYVNRQAQSVPNVKAYGIDPQVAPPD